MDNTRPTNVPPDQHQTPVQNQQSSNSMVGNTKEILTPFIAPRANHFDSVLGTHKGYFVPSSTHFKGHFCPFSVFGNLS